VVASGDGSGLNSGTFLPMKVRRTPAAHRHATANASADGAVPEGNPGLYCELNRWQCYPTKFEGIIVSRINRRTKEQCSTDRETRLALFVEHAPAIANRAGSARVSEMGQMHDHSGRWSNGWASSKSCRATAPKGWGELLRRERTIERTARECLHVLRGPPAVLIACSEEPPTRSDSASASSRCYGSVRRRSAISAGLAGARGSEATSSLPWVSSSLVLSSAGCASSASAARAWASGAAAVCSSATSARIPCLLHGRFHRSSTSLAFASKTQNFELRATASRTSTKPDESSSPDPPSANARSPLP
jgi:hypothetical protein